MLNVFDIAVPEVRSADRLLSELPADTPVEPNSYNWFAVDPNVLYPQALAHVNLVASGTQRPPDPLGKYWDQARALDPQAWEWALLDRSECDSEMRAAREQALELARLWFTEMLHQAVGGPLGLHIQKNERWRL